MPTIIQPSFAGGELSPRLHGRVDLAKYQTGADTIENFIVRPEGGLIRRPGTRYAGAAKYPAKRCRLVPFQFSTTQAYVLEFGDLYMRVWKDHGQVETVPGAPYEIALPYLETQLAALAFAQSADVLYIAHNAHQPRKLSRTGHTAWTLSPYEPQDGPFLERNIDVAKTVYASADTGAIALTASAAIFDAGQVGSLFWIQMPDLAAVSPWESDTSGVAAGNYCRYNGHYYKALAVGSANKTGTVPPTHDEGKGYDGIGTKNVQWEFQHKGFGVVKITSFTSSTVVGATVLTRLPHTVVGSGNPTSKWSEAAWSSLRGYPSAVSFHEQRLVWANTPARPQTVWASRSGDYERFEAGTKDDDAFVYGIASNQVNAIRWIASGSNMLIGTVGQEFAAFGGGLGDPITPSAVRIVPQSGEGSSITEPARLGNETLFVNRAGRKLMTLAFAVDSDGYAVLDLTQLADHLTTDAAAIAEIAWAREPLRTLWARRADGLLLSFTYKREEQVFAWARHPRDGNLESLAVIPTPDGTSDELWLVTKRVIGGASVRHVEYLTQPFAPKSATDKLTMMYLDAALEYGGPPATSLSGLGHLEGRSLKVVADGALHPDCVVSAGAIALDRPVTQAFAGIGFVSKLRTLRPETYPVSVQGRIKRIVRLIVRVLNSLGGKAGPDETALDDLIRRDQSDPTDASPPLRSGDIEVAIASDYDTNGQVTIVQADPLPLDIVCLMPQLAVNEG